MCAVPRAANEETWRICERTRRWRFRAELDYDSVGIPSAEDREKLSDARRRTYVAVARLGRHAGRLVALMRRTTVGGAGKDGARR